MKITITLCMQQNTNILIFFESTIFRGIKFSCFKITRENNENKILEKTFGYTVSIYSTKTYKSLKNHVFLIYKIWYLQ